MVRLEVWLDAADGTSTRDGEIHVIGRGLHEVVSLGAPSQEAPCPHSGSRPVPRQGDQPAPRLVVVADLPAGEFELWPVVEGYRSLPSPVEIGDRDLVMHVQLEPGMTLSGVVRSVEAAPLAGVGVSWFGASALERRVTVSAADGTFRLTGLGDTGAVVFCAKEHAPVVVPLEHMPRTGDTFGIDLSLPIGVTYFGRVLDAAGRPVLGEVIEVIKDHGVQLPFPMPASVTGSEGRYVLRHAPIGPMRLAICGQSAPVTGEDGQMVEMNLRLAP